MKINMDHEERLLPELFPDTNGEYQIGKLYSNISTNYDPVLEEYQIVMLLKITDIRHAIEVLVLGMSGEVVEFNFTKQGNWFMKQIHTK